MARVSEFKGSQFALLQRQVRVAGTHRCCARRRAADARPGLPPTPAAQYHAVLPFEVTAP